MESVRGMLGMGRGKVLWSAGGHRGPLVIALSAGVRRVEAEVSTCVEQYRFNTYAYVPICVRHFIQVYVFLNFSLNLLISVSISDHLFLIISLKEMT